MHGKCVSFEWKAILVVTALFALGSIANQAAQAQTYKVLHTFTGYPSDGQNPFGGVIFDAENNLYGTTVEGGLHCGNPGCGTVFRLTQQSNGTWTETLLHAFGGDDGRHPRNESLLMDKSGNLFGTTAAGGRGLRCYQGDGMGCGTVFELSPTTGIETVLHYFGEKSGKQGARPFGGLIRDADGNFYGTTALGGDYEGGVAFELDSTGKEIVLHSFGKGNDGWKPFAGVIDFHGDLYGTTFAGGTFQYWGTVFRLRGQKETVLHSFRPRGYLNSGLIADAEGNLYGTTAEGGGHGAGTVFKMDSSGKVTILYGFTGTDGYAPYGSLIRDEYGNLYGTTSSGGAADYGTVFKLSPGADGKWIEKVLHTFSGADGIFPSGTLIRDAEGNLYGTTVWGGYTGSPCNVYPGGCGVVFEITP